MSSFRLPLGAHLWLPKHRQYRLCPPAHAQAASQHCQAKRQQRECPAQAASRLPPPGQQALSRDCGHRQGLRENCSAFLIDQQNRNQKIRANSQNPLKPTPELVKSFLSTVQRGGDRVRPPLSPTQAPKHFEESSKTNTCCLRAQIIQVMASVTDFLPSLAVMQRNLGKLIK